MSELTITQIRKIIGWSYPTAFNFARQHGRQVEGVWYIPFDDVAAVVQTEMIKAQKMQARLIEAGNGSK